MFRPDTLSPDPTAPLASPSSSSIPYAFEEIQSACPGGEASRLERQSRFLEAQGLLDQLPPLPDAGEVLDVGSGTGHWALRLAERVPRGRVTCLDRSADLLDHARTRLERGGVRNAAFLHQDLRSLDLPARRFDLVFTSLCLVHMVELEATLAGLVRALKPGGWIACFEPVQDRHGMFDSFPPCPELGFLVDQLRIACEQRGSDFRAGLRIAHALDGLGLEDTALRYFGSAPRGPVLEAYLEEVFLPIARPCLADRLRPGELERRLAAARAEIRRPGTWINLKQTVVLGRKPPAAADQTAE
jgi:SAM-dependent methyltransferase